MQENGFTDGARRKRALALSTSAAISALSFALAGAAQAQSAATPTTGGANSGSASEADASEVQSIIVTGSRIPTTNLKSISPVTTTTAEDIKSLGVVDLEAALRDLPEAFPGRGESTNNNGNGDTSANLRDLGPQRTLVLVDGKRMVGSDSKGEVDLDSIPPGMIDHIDVVTGGASAVYGADAVAGVVNVILKKNFSGLQLDVQGGAYDQGDGQKYTANLLAGTDFANGKGNITTFAEYTQRTRVNIDGRDWADPPLKSNGNSLVPNISSLIPAGRDLDSGLMFNSSGQLVPYDGSRYDHTGDEYLLTPQERVSVGLNGHYEATPWADVYFRATFSQNNVARQVVDGTPVDDVISVNYGNPLLSNQERSVLFSPGAHLATDTTSFEYLSDLLQNGNTGERDRYDTYEAVSGVTGQLGSHFTYDVSAQYGETDWRQVLLGDVSPSRFQQGLLVNPDGACEDPSNGCAPINIFTSAAGAITTSQVKFFNLVQTANSVTRQIVGSASISGDLGQLGLKSPLANTPVGVSVGTEYRYESSNYSPDSNLAVGNNLVFGNIPPLSGHYDVGEWYFEVRVPLVEDLPLAKSITLEGGYRYSDYNIEGTAGTYKIGGVWQPIDDVRFRAAYEVAARAPDIGELFNSPQKEAATGVDPCFGSNGAAPTASAALCKATGVPAGAYGNPVLQCPDQRCEIFEGGNSALKLEVAHSTTLGVAVTPSAVPGLLVTADYYDIRITNAIGSLSQTAQQVLDGCYGAGPGENPTQSPNNVYCKAIQRSPTGDIFTGGFNGSLGDISLLNSNISFLGVKGVDFALNYRTRFDRLGLDAIPGSIALRVSAAYVSSYQTQSNPELPTYQCAGAYGQICGQPIPNWRVTAQATWSPAEAVSITLRSRYIGGAILDTDKFAGMDLDPPDHEIPSRTYFDLSSRWRVTPKLTLRAGLTNLFNVNPPQVSGTIANALIFGFGNTFPGTYDIGRQFDLGATVDF